MKKLLELYWIFVKIGSVAFGGGYAMLPILQKEFVINRQWATDEELMDYFAIGQCTPGIISINVATFIGNKQKGIMGALAATIGFVTVPIILILFIAAFLTNFADLEIVNHAFAGIRVAVCVLILSAIERLWKKSIINNVPIILLREHYRCHPKIIEFCNNNGLENLATNRKVVYQYNNAIFIKTINNLKIKNESIIIDRNINSMIKK